MSTADKTVKVNFIEHNGTVHSVQAGVGSSIMQAAVNNLVPGIDADCGGLCACATCHGFVDPEWLDRVSTKTSSEDELLQGIPSATPESRLTCQLQLTEEMDGIVVRLPESQC